MNNSHAIDVDFDFRSDTPRGRDPDSRSPTMRRYHQLLWSKQLPNGQVLELRTDAPGIYLLHESRMGRFTLSSDTIYTSHRKRLAPLYAQCSKEDNEALHRRGYTVAGVLVFPSNRIDGNQTMNQRRGTHRLIEDRIDLTLECIRRHYAAEQSPLSQTTALYSDFFALFHDFLGYVEYFHLGDLLTKSGAVGFLTPFTDFKRGPLPSNLTDYVAYRERTMEFLLARRDRIAAAIGSSLCPSRTTPPPC